jgi:hypothetical protein
MDASWRHLLCSSAWVFAVTPKDRNTLITNFTRVVNNINMQTDANYSKFSSLATGELQRK